MWAETFELVLKPGGASPAPTRGCDPFKEWDESRTWISDSRMGREEMVRAEGFEPPRPCGHQLLRLARLPVPPRPHCL